jgi:hypothetical protein
VAQPRRHTLALLILLCPPAAPAWAAPAAGKALPRWRQPADPEPLLTADYLELAVAREKGQLKVLSVEKRAFPKPQVLLPRFRGRFEVRLLSASGQLRDVIRFDLPLTGASTPAGSPDQDDALGRKLSLGVSSARTRVRAPFDASIVTATVVDSLTKTAVRVDVARFRPRAPAPSLPAPALPALKKAPPNKK